MRHFLTPNRSFALSIFLCVLSLFSLENIAHAQPEQTSPIHLSVSEKIAILPHSELFTDESHALTFQDITTERYAKKFQPFTRIQNARSAYWLRFSLKNTDSVPHKHYLLVGSPLLDSALFFHRTIQQNGTPHGTPLAPVIVWDSSVSGSSIAFSKRPLPLKGVWHIVTIPPNAVERVFVRITAPNGLAIDMTLYNEDQFRAYRDAAITFYSVFAGMMLFAMVYNMVLAISTRDKAYGYYVLHGVNII